MSDATSTPIAAAPGSAGGEATVYELKLPLARLLVGTLDDQLETTVQALVLAGDIGSLQSMLAALNEAKLHNQEKCRSVSMALVAWGDEADPARQALSKAWLTELGGVGSDLFTNAREELLEMVGLHDPVTFDAKRAKFLADLVIKPGSAPDAVTMELSDVISKLIDRRNMLSTPEQRAATADVFEHIVRMDARVNPDRMMDLTVWNPTYNLEVRPKDAHPDSAQGLEWVPSASSLFLVALHNNVQEWLEPLAAIYKPQVFRKAVNDAVLALAAEGKMEPTSNSPTATPILKGWLDAETANTVLSSTRSLKKFRNGQLETVMGSYAGELAMQSPRNEQTLEMVRQLHAAGADLDIQATVRQPAPSTLAWKGSMLHTAVEHGSPELVGLLLALDCDPYKRSVAKNMQTQERQVRDCFQIVESNTAPTKDSWELDRREMIDLVLRAWKAQQQAKDALALIDNPEAGAGARVLAGATP